jgi:hypothetical protein
MVKAFARISKQLLLDMCKPRFEAQSSDIEPEYKNYRKCKKTCPWYNENKVTCQVCSSCPFVLSKSSILGLRKDAISFTQIKQLLFYHSMIYNNDGFTPLLTHDYVAAQINCSVKTARENIKILENTGYIVTSKDGTGYVAYIIEYNNYHNSKRGYLDINHKLLTAILNTNNFNELRLALYCLVKLDDMNVQKKDTPIKKFTYEALINVLPTYIHTKKQVNVILIELSKKLNLFDIHVKDGQIILGESDCNNTTYLKATLKKHKKALKHFIKKFNLKLEKKEKEDIKQMQLQYNNIIIEKALGIYVEHITDKDSDSPITNLGGYLRTIIKNNIFNGLIFSTK